MRIVKKCYYPLLILFAAALAILGCTSNTESAGSAAAKPPALFASLEDKFIGEWKSLESTERPHLFIIRNGDNFIIKSEKSEFPAVFDDENKILQFNVPASVGVGGTVPETSFDIAYLEKED